MKKDNFLTIERFKDPNAAADFIQLLEDNSIDYKIEDGSPDFDVTFSNSSVEDEMYVKVRSSEFEKVRDIQESYYGEVELDELPKDYYLFRFSDVDLNEIILNPEEWSVLDYSLAKKVLAYRGKPVDEDLIKALLRQKAEKEKKPEKNAKTMIYGGYLLAILGSLFGLILGFQILTHKKTVQSGERVYAYTKEDREHGRNIIVVSVFMALLYAILYYKYGITDY